MNLYSAPEGTPPPGDKLTNYTQVGYNVDEGVLVTIDEMLGLQTRDIVCVRAELQEKVLRQAVIYEMEKLGYTVLSPEPGEGEM